MHIITQIAVSVFGTLSAYGLFLGAQFLYQQLTSPLRNLPGPPNSSWIYGNSKEIQSAANSVAHEKWVEEHGNTIVYKWFFSYRLFTLDVKAINHVLMSGPYTYQKPGFLQRFLTDLLGSGLLVQESDQHRLQRKVMNPAFGGAQIREMTDIFVEESLHLKDIWLSQMSSDDKATRIDVPLWLSRMTLDVIGRAGFNYRFNALDSIEPDPLNKAFSTIFGTANKISLWTVFRNLIPILRVFPTANGSTMKESKSIMDRIGRELLEESKRHLYATGEKDENWSARDLLSLLVRSNMSKDIAENQRMTDEDVLAQIPTFLVAGHETSATATTWALFSMVKNKEIQRKLREELLEVTTENPTMDVLNSLPYLDAVVRETLRIHAPVAGTSRVATKDDILPLEIPFTDKNGVVHDGVRVRKGETIFIPILAMNRSKALWGEDARDFKPERWITPGGVPSAVSAIPGVWGNMLSFLGGPHACIGYRFALVEVKALLFVLVRAFEFDLAVPEEDVIAKTSIVQRPHLKSEPEKGSQLPLLIKPYVPS
ncbi:hypothetical protein GYMLUDRAFT_45751 [Collybiopsis luxurians FD-317 M1]|uniref:Cytochrome P450 n=1 Tax=Collybiopsis luxurians FD-317 M1 TaxID=944289 RepID=A0A0D0BRT9_9AGAR|nr:hypothetical protein GYMLUDRAFT_45751 [Collybiopsis luxurians FD-317 M1]